MQKPVILCFVLNFFLVLNFSTAQETESLERHRRNRESSSHSKAEEVLTPKEVRPTASAKFNSPEESCNHSWIHNAWYFLKSQIVNKPEGTGDFVVLVTDDTCKGDLEAWNKGIGVTAIEYKITDPKSAIAALRKRGYGPGPGQKKAGTIALSGHGCSTPEMCFISASHGCIGSGMSQDEMKGFEDSMAQDGVLWLMGCYAGKHDAPLKQWANGIHRRVVANTDAVRAGNTWAEGEWKTVSPD